MLIKGLNFDTLDARRHAVWRHEWCDRRCTVVSSGAVSGSIFLVRSWAVELRWARKKYTHFLKLAGKKAVKAVFCGTDYPLYRLYRLFRLFWDSFWKMSLFFGDYKFFSNEVIKKLQIDVFFVLVDACKNSHFPVIFDWFAKSRTTLLKAKNMNAWLAIWSWKPK